MLSIVNWDEIREIFKANQIYLRLSFFYTFVLRIALIFLVWGSLLGYLTTLDWKVRLGHYLALYLITLFLVLLFRDAALKLFFSILRWSLFFSLDFPALRKLNRAWLQIVSRLLMPFVRIISFNYFLASLLFFLASSFHSEWAMELLFLAFFFRIVFSMLMLGPRFLLLGDALAFYQRASLRTPALPCLPAPVDAFAYSANIVVFRPFLSGFSYIVRYAIHNFVRFDDFRKPFFYASFFVFPPFRLMPAFLLHGDTDFVIAYFGVLLTSGPAPTLHTRSHTAGPT